MESAMEAFEQPDHKHAAAVRTLEALNYEWRGGQVWAPPLSYKLDFTKANDAFGLLEAIGLRYSGNAWRRRDPRGGWSVADASKLTEAGAKFYAGKIPVVKGESDDLDTVTESDLKMYRAATDLLMDAGYVHSPNGWHAPKDNALDCAEPGYDSLAGVLHRAYLQASTGKGKERHANGKPFEDQPMQTINKTLGSIDGFIYQAHKKSGEARGLPQGRNVAELLGAINYLAGAVIALESWAKKESS